MAKPDVHERLSIMAEFAISSILKKAFIIPYGVGGIPKVPIPVLFNPTEYSVAKSNTFPEIAIPGLESPLIQFARGNIKTLKMDLFFDTYTDLGGIDVRIFTHRITNLLKIDSDLHAPPVCLFFWGTFWFKGVLQQVSQRFTMFNSLGMPVRATLSVTFKEYTTVDMQVRATPLSSPDRTKQRIVMQGDSLWLLAAREYGDATKWRSIADKNQIENPRFLEPGMEILIPPLEG
jgi:hypothetical protein